TAGQRDSGTAGQRDSGTAGQPGDLSLGAFLFSDGGAGWLISFHYPFISQKIFRQIHEVILSGATTCSWLFLRFFLRVNSADGQ
ncbi:MAG: hypothetical protein LBQ42_03680, partial [Synergistaceae bacterium]|nr:hypothetical protein [Synergistaceae bacterium]